MKLKRILAGALAGVMAMTSMAFTVSAAGLVDAPEGTETVLQAFDLSSIDVELTRYENGPNASLTVSDITWFEEDDVYLKATLTNVGLVNGSALEDVVTWDYASWAHMLNYYNNYGENQFTINFIPIKTSTSDECVCYVPISDAALNYTNSLQGNLQGGQPDSITISALEIVRVSTAPATVDVEKVELDKTTLELEVEGTATLKATVTPEDATDKTVTWTSSDEAVVTVKDGEVTAVKAGTATITAKAGEKTAECKVTVTEPAADEEVEDIPATKLEVLAAEEGLELIVGEESNIGAGASIEPKDTTDTILFESADTKIATVDEEGMVKAVAAGETVIKVTTKLNKELSAEVKVVVKEEEVLDEGKFDNGKGEYVELPADEIPAMTNDKGSVSADKFLDTKADTLLTYADGKLYIYAQYSTETDLAKKTEASVIVKHTNGKALKLTTSAAYNKLTKDIIAAEGNAFIAFVITGVSDSANDATYWGNFSCTDITLA